MLWLEVNIRKAECEDFTFSSVVYQWHVKTSSVNSLAQSDLNEKGVCSATYLVSCFSKPLALKDVFLLGLWR